MPLVLVFAPVTLVLRQPDLGTADDYPGRRGDFFLAGVRMWKFVTVLVLKRHIPIAGSSSIIPEKLLADLHQPGE